MQAKSRYFYEMHAKNKLPKATNPNHPPRDPRVAKTGFGSNISINGYAKWRQQTSLHFVCKLGIRKRVEQFNQKATQNGPHNVQECVGCKKNKGLRAKEYAQSSQAVRGMREKHYGCATNMRIFSASENPETRKTQRIRSENVEFECQRKKKRRKHYG